MQNMQSKHAGVTRPTTTLRGCQSILGEPGVTGGASVFPAVSADEPWQSSSVSCFLVLDVKL